MALVPLTWKTIGDLDEGRAGLMINEVLSALFRDLEDRGHDEKAREVTIKLTAVSAKGMTVLDLQAAVKIPAFRTNNTLACMHNSKDGNKPHLCFQEFAPDNPDQNTLPLEEEKEGDD